MIQNSYIKPVELKAPERVKSPSAGEKKSKDLTSSDDKNDFSKELKAASISDDSKVKKVEVSSDKELRKPSSLIGHPEEGNPDSVEQKVFDPAMTQDVQNLIQPKTVDAVEVTDEMVLKLANGEVAVEGEVDLELKAEISQALLKTPQTTEADKAGLNPISEQNKSEIDSQLVNMEDFVAQKNMGNKKNVPNQAYGMKKPETNKVALEQGLKPTQVVNDTAALENLGSQNPGSVNSQQFILNMQSEQGANKLTETTAPMKTFDMSGIKSADADKIMNQITDYIVQAKAAKEPTVSMRMNHDQLGMIDITVAKAAGMNNDAVAINIGAHSMDGKSFFQQNSKDLFAHLANAGINVADMKVESPNTTAKNDFDFNSQHKGQQGSEKQFGSESNQRRHDAEKRADLWKQFNKEAA